MNANQLNSDTAVETVDVSKFYGEVRAVDGVSLTVESGQYFVLLGPSGGGKTTLLRLIGGFVRPTQGQVLLHGADVSDLPPNKRSTSMVFQSYALFPHMSVEKNVSYGLKLQKMPLIEQARKVTEMLALVGLEGYGRRMPHELSGGQQQRVGIARALVQEPSVMLADEPVASLDPVTSRQVMGDLRRINRDLGITTIVNLHYLDLAREFGSRLVGLRDGELVFDGDIADVDDETFMEIYGRAIGDDDLVGTQDDQT